MVFQALAGLMQAVKDVFASIREMVGWYPEDAKIIFLGLDSAGKTTLLQMLAKDRLGCNAPTVHNSQEEIYYQGRTFVARDMGGHQTVRRLWKDYIANIDAIFFLVDAANRSRLEEARQELHKLLAIENIRDVPIVILGNKIDVPIAVSQDEFLRFMGLEGGMGRGSDKWGAGYSSESAPPAHTYLMDWNARHTSGGGYGSRGGQGHNYNDQGSVEMPLYLTNAYYPVLPDKSMHPTMHFFEPCAHRAPLEVFMTSILHKQGYGAAFKWMAQSLKDRPQWAAYK